MAADDVAAKLRAASDDVNCFGVILAMGQEWEPNDQWVKSMTLPANEVMADLLIELTSSVTPGTYTPQLRDPIKTKKKT